ncbi:polysaccharide export protein [Novosphingobium sp. KCTC 2891]|uniref:polysaccharide biosynthesis/export family protein n=1 Tax=Novosphingobium sp. KCTC 2891 TaxID=2989730 RepID=UPI00222306AB|nr:polysaccharide biosynthesis/export family protein [Novosphingobium sp. KCTC 2891]MCW1383255.1 polysaccharide export protein [Novosphingobium sp. KCTC 2891]
MGSAAYTAIEDKPEGAAINEVIQPNDRLAIRVLGEPELTSDNFYVDANGYIQVPLAGEIDAAGHTPRQLREAIIARLAARYIRNPDVSVIVIERTRNTFSVEGDVREPGVFEVGPDTTLLTAMARAKSPTNVAKLDEIMIFRTVNGQRMGARFDIRQIRAGNAPDPRVLAGDMVVVGHSNSKGVFRDILQAAPLLNVFVLLNNNVLN